MRWLCAIFMVWVSLNPHTVKTFVSEHPFAPLLVFIGGLLGSALEWVILDHLDKWKKPF